MSRDKHQHEEREARIKEVMDRAQKLQDRAKTATRPSRPKRAPLKAKTAKRTP